MKPINRTMGLAEWSMLLTFSAVWGASFYFTALALVDMPVLTLSVARMVVAVSILYLAIRLSGEAVPRGWGLWRDFAVMGFFNSGLPFLLVVWAQKSVPGGLAAIIIASTPIWTVVAAHFFTSDEKVDAGKVAGVLLGMAGVVLVIGPSFLSAMSGNLIAQFACLCAAFLYAFGGIYGRRFRARNLSPFVLAFGQGAASLSIQLPLALLIDHPWSLPVPGLSAWGGIFGVALLSTVVANLIYYRLLSSAGATNMLLSSFLAPVSAILLGVLLLGEHLTPWHFGGMMLIGIGLACIDGRALKRLRSVPA